MRFSIKPWLASVAMACAAFLSFAAVAQTSIPPITTTNVCPTDFKVAIASASVCVANNLSDARTVLDIPPERECPRGFERPPGVGFCVASNLVLDIQDQKTLISKKTTRDCPRGFSKPYGSTICVADDLVLDLIDNKAVLVEMLVLCAKGMHKPEGARFCRPEDVSPEILPAPAGLICPPGFIRPPGVRFCVASNFLWENPENHASVPKPPGECPKGWYKPENVNLCVPTHVAAPCGPECGPLQSASLILKNTFGSKIQPCPPGSVAIWWDMPEYDEEGLFIIGSIPTRVCITEDLKPEG